MPSPRETALLLVLHMQAGDATALLGLAGGACGRMAATTARAHGDREENLYRIFFAFGLAVAAYTVWVVLVWEGRCDLQVTNSLALILSRNEHCLDHTWSLPVSAN